MKIKNLLGLVVVAVMMTTSPGLKAQTLNQGQQQGQQIEVSDSELNTFAKIMREAQSVQRQSQNSMMKAIQNSDIEMKRFQEISRARRQGNKVEMTEKEKQAFSEIQKVMKQEQQKMRKKMSSIIEKYSITKKRYMQINRALRKNKQLQNRLKSIIGKQRQQQQPQQQ
jgi:hypothetical protein